MENPDRFVRDVVQKPARAATLWGVQVVVLITLASAFLHALWNAGLRLERDKDGAVVVAIAVATLVAAVVAALRLALAGEAFGGWEALGFTLLAGVLEGGYFAALARALDTGALGPVYTISRGGTLLLVWPASVWLWSEELNATRLVGSFIVAAGLALCSGARGATRTAVAWSALCAVLIAGYHLAYKAALLAGGDGPAVFTVSLALATVVNVSRLGQDGRTRALALGAATFALYSLWYSRLGRAPSGKLTVGQRLPALELLGANGEPYSTSALAGHPALLFFYRGNWCPLCMAQIKEVAGHYRELSALGAKVVLISPQPHGNTAELARRFDVSFDFVTDVGNRAARALDLEMKDGLPMGMGLLGYDHDTVFPTVLVLDRDGVIRWADQTDNYRVRPEPSTFLPLLRELAAQKPRRQAA